MAYKHPLVFPCGRMDGYWQRNPSLDKGVQEGKKI
jgi:hypothetical protein